MPFQYRLPLPEQSTFPGSRDPIGITEVPDGADGPGKDIDVVLVTKHSELAERVRLPTAAAVAHIRIDAPAHATV